ncbi:hypothetical protein VTK26DRAFT_9449 [Humicola hyalothermophila]
MKYVLFQLFLLVGLVISTPAPRQSRHSSELPRLVLYHQTTHDSKGRPVSILPLVTKKHIALTHLIVAAFHVRPSNSSSSSSIRLNDHPSTTRRFSTLWNETRILQSAGIKVMGMVGGAAPGSFTAQTLDGDIATFERAYSRLASAIRAHRLDGMDLDVEQPMSQAGIARLVRRLRADFGPRFLITLAPVTSALHGQPRDGRTLHRNLSGFDYLVLERDVGDVIAFYNAQFYSGFGDLRSTRDFDRAVAAGWEPARIVAGQLTAAAHGSGGGAGFITFSQLNQTVQALMNRYGEIGGIMGWEYFNSDPDGERAPWRWAQIMTQILRPDAVPTLAITAATAEVLRQAWLVSSMADASTALNVDYLSMVNA